MVANAVNCHCQSMPKAILLLCSFIVVLSAADYKNLLLLFLNPRSTSIVVVTSSRSEMTIV